MRAYRERITLQAPTISEASGNYGTKRVTFTAGSFVSGLKDLHASFEHVGGGESMRSGSEQLDPEVIGIFECRLPRVAVKPTYQLLHVNAGNKAYGVVSARPKEGVDEGGFRTLRIFVKALADV